MYMLNIKRGFGFKNILIPMVHDHIILTSCFWMKYASPDHYEINGINLSENKSTFLYQTETKEEKNKYQRAERQRCR